MLNTGSRAGARIVTGDASEIGLAMTARLLAAGWRVTTFDRDASNRHLHKTFGDKVRTSLLDVTDEAAVEVAVKHAAATFGSSTRRQFGRHRDRYSHAGDDGRPIPQRD